VLDTLHKGPATIDSLGSDNRIDLRDRGEARIPHGLGVIASEVVDELGQRQIGYTGHVRGGGHGVDAAGAAPFEHSHAAASPLEKVGSRQPGNPGAHHDYVYIQIATQPAVLRHLGRVGPV
jgi:hypothetical protein